MRLGTQTGSLVNHLYSNAGGTPAPEVGMGATVLAWTDRHAGTIIEVKPDGSFTVQEDHAERTDSNGMSESQDYAYTPDPDGRLFQFRQIKRGQHKGKYVQKGSTAGHGYRVLIGERRKYHDFSF